MSVISEKTTPSKPFFFLSYPHTMLYIPVISSIAATIIGCFKKALITNKKNFIMRSVLGSIGIGPVFAIIDLFATLIRKVRKNLPTPSTTDPDPSTPTINGCINPYTTHPAPSTPSSNPSSTPTPLFSRPQAAGNDPTHSAPASSLSSIVQDRANQVRSKYNLGIFPNQIDSDLNDPSLWVW